MTASNPPRLATALLSWMGPRDEALIGDLLETYRAGRSDWWYWRQVLSAVVIGVVVAVREHKLLPIRAIVIGWLAVWLYGNYVGDSVLFLARAVVNFGEFLFVTGLTDWFYVHDIDLPAIVVRATPPIVTTFVGMCASGWLVGYSHRSTGPASVLIYCATVPLPAAATLAWQSVARGEYAGPPLVYVAALVWFVTASALIGGLWAVRAGRVRHQPDNPINAARA